MRILLRELTKRFAQQAVVDHLDLEVSQGEFLVLLGPSGSGKTTTLRMIAGLEEPDEGRIWMGERDVTRLPPRSRDVAMVFQSYALYPHLSVAENIAFPLRVRKVPRGETVRRVRQVAGKLGLERLLERRPRELSGGERQRVALARAIVRQPNAFLMDEPLSNLDAQQRLETRAELKRLQHELGVTTVYVTHDQAEAMTLAHHVAVLCEGKLQQVDTPANLYRTPANLFVAGFVGSPPMNLLKCSADPGAAVISTDGTAWHLGKESHEILARLPGKVEVVVGIRPEHLLLFHEARPGAAPARVYVSEPAGHENIVVVRVGGKMLTARAPAALELDYDQTVWVGVVPEELHFFDLQTGRAL